MDSIGTPDLVALNILSPPQMVLLGALALIVFGPKRLPEIARNLGAALREFRKASRDLIAHFEDEVNSPRVQSVARTAYDAESYPKESAQTPHDTVPTSAERTQGHGTQ